MKNLVGLAYEVSYPVLAYGKAPLKVRAKTMLMGKRR